MYFGLLTGFDRYEGVERAREEDDVAREVEGRGIEFSEVAVGIERDGKGLTIHGPGEKREIEGA